MPVSEGTLFAVDEASMMPGPDLADLIALAERHGGKVIVAGDTEQLQAVNNGGGMSLLAGRLGYVRLAEPVRFRAAWERAASLRLRDGDGAVADEYDQHARINGGDPELMIEAAAADYTALAASDTDALLIAADHALRRELSRRVRENLLRLGLVDGAQTVTIAGGAAAGRRRPDHVHPQRPPCRGRGAGADPGQRRPAPHRRHHHRGPPRPPRARRRPAKRAAPLDGPTVPVRALPGCRARLRGHRPRRPGPHRPGRPGRLHRQRGPPARYVALTRGTDDNTAYVFTTPTKLSDPAPGARPAPELARYDRLTAQADGPAPGDPDAPATTSAVGVLAEMITGRDGAAQSASQAWRQALADADHLAVLHAIWTAETTPARERRYRALLESALPPGTGQQDSHKEQWLHRTLRAAELAGLDPGEVLARAVAERDLTGARDIPAVIDARIRRRHGDLAPLPAPSWSAQVPQTDDPGRRRFLIQLAAAMDDRRRRIGEHAAASTLPWAIAALGAPPDDPAARLDWQRKAAAIGAYRELSGHDHPDDPIGPEPATGSPDLRAAWHEARAALTLDEAGDIRHLTDGQLLNLRAARPDDARAPLPAVGKLRQARAAARDANLAALRSHAEASAARRRGEHDEAARQETLAASYQAMRDAYRARETELDTATRDLQATEREKGRRLRLAEAADAELRHRHPRQPWPSLPTAEPQPAPGRGHDHDGEREIPIDSGHSREHDHDSQPPAPATDLAETSRQVEEAAKRHRDLAARLADPHRLTIPAAVPVRDISPDFPLTSAQRRTAILQPPKPEIPPSSWILERVAGRDLDPEATD